MCEANRNNVSPLTVVRLSIKMCTKSRKSLYERHRNVDESEQGGKYLSLIHI